MSAGNKKALFLGLAGILMLAGVVAKPLHIPPAGQILVMSGVAACYFLYYLTDRKQKAAHPASAPKPVAPLAARKRLFWIVASALITGSVGFLPLMPYTVDNYHPWLYFFVVPFQIVFLTVFLVFFWRKLMRPENAGARVKSTLS